MALSVCRKQLVWVENAISELGLSNGFISAIHSDNQSAIQIANDAKISDQSKHISVHYHAVREAVQSGKLTILYVPSADNLADICTKGLPTVTLNRLREKILG
jgi:hypothetical protein